MWYSLPFLCLSADSKPTAETLGPTVKSEETTTPYPIDEEATECGGNCSFEDGEDGARAVLHLGWHGCRPVAVEAGPRLEPAPGGPLGQRSGKCGT